MIWLDTFRQSMKKLLHLKVRFNCNNCIVPSGLGKGTIPLWQASKVTVIRSRETRIFGSPQRLR